MATAKDSGFKLWFAGLPNVGKVRTDAAGFTFWFAGLPSVTTNAPDANTFPALTLAP